jgi:hypothetical protein
MLGRINLIVRGELGLRHLLLIEAFQMTVVGNGIPSRRHFFYRGTILVMKRAIQSFHFLLSV